MTFARLRQTARGYAFVHNETVNTGSHLLLQVRKLHVHNNGVSFTASLVVSLVLSRAVAVSCSAVRSKVQPVFCLSDSAFLRVVTSVIYFCNDVIVCSFVADCRTRSLSTTACTSPISCSGHWSTSSTRFS